MLSISSISGYLIWDFFFSNCICFSKVLKKQTSWVLCSFFDCSPLFNGKMNAINNCSKEQVTVIDKKERGAYAAEYNTLTEKWMA